MPLLSRLTTVLVAAALGVVASAQVVEFEVASVKPHTSDDQRVMMVAQPGGRFVAANIPLKLLIRTTFQIQDDQTSVVPAGSRPIVSTSRPGRQPGTTGLPSCRG